MTMMGWTLCQAQHEDRGTVMIFIEDERVKLDGVVLPGLVKSIEVTESAKIDEQEVEGSAVKPKQATGYEDAKVNIELIIDDTETKSKYERYAALRELFRKPGQNVPKSIPIVCEDTAAHGIEKVLFKKLTHKGENKKNQLVAHLELWEYIPQTITAVSTAKTSSSGSSSKSSTKSTGNKAPSTSAPTQLDTKYQSYLGSGRGSPPEKSGGNGVASNMGKGDKTSQSKSPAADNADTTKASLKLTRLPF